MEELIKILKEVKPDVDYNTVTGLIDDEILDSLDIVTIVSKINKEFDIDFPVSEIVPKNFNSAKALYEAVKKIEEE